MENSKLEDFSPEDRKKAKDFLRLVSLALLGFVLVISFIGYKIDPFASEAERIVQNPFKLCIKDVISKKKQGEGRTTSYEFHFWAEKSCKVDQACYDTFQVGDTLELELLKNGEGAVFKAQKITKAPDFKPLWEKVALTESELAPFASQDQREDWMLIGTLSAVLLVILLLSFPRWNKLRIKVAAGKKLVMLSKIQAISKQKRDSFILLENGTRIDPPKKLYEYVRQGDTVQVHLLPEIHYVLSMKVVERAS